jgi:hypothetical protein
VVVASLGAAWRLGWLELGEKSNRVKGFIMPIRILSERNNLISKEENGLESKRMRPKIWIDRMPFCVANQTVFATFLIENGHLRK